MPYAGSNAGANGLEVQTMNDLLVTRYRHLAAEPWRTVLTILVFLGVSAWSVHGIEPGGCDNLPPPPPDPCEENPECCGAGGGWGPLPAPLSFASPPPNLHGDVANFQGSRSTQCLGPALDFRINHHSRRYYNGVMGQGWSHSYDVYVQEPASVPGFEWIDARINSPSGYALDYTSYAGSYVPTHDTMRLELFREGEGASTYYYAVDRTDDTEHLYVFSERDVLGQTDRWYLSRVEDLHGRAVTLQYVVCQDSVKRLARVVGASGRYLELQYDFTVNPPVLKTVALFDSAEALVANLFELEYSDGYLSAAVEYVKDLGTGVERSYRTEYDYRTEPTETYNIEHRRVFRTPEGDPAQEYGETYWEYWPDSRIKRQVVWADNERTQELVETRWTYDKTDGGERITVTAEGGNYSSGDDDLIRTYWLNDRGGLVGYRDALGYESTNFYTYAAGCCTSEHTVTNVNQAGHVTTYVRDFMGRATKIVRDDSAGGAKLTQEMFYNEHDRLTRRILYRGDGSTIDFETIYEYVEGHPHDLHRIIAREGSSDWVLAEYEYYRESAAARDGLVSAIITETGRWEYDYDNRGNVTSIKNPRTGLTTTCDYDAKDDLEWVEDPLGNRENRSYDTWHRLTKQWWGTNTVVYQSYEYDRVNTKHELAKIRDEEGVWTHFERDRAGRITNVVHNAGTGPGETRTAFGYDWFDNTVEVTEPGGGTTEYRYTLRNQIERIEYPGTGLIGDLEFSYDEVGNLAKRIQRDKTGGGVAEATAYGYDDLNRLERIDYGDDGSDELTYEYEYPGIGSGASWLLSQVADGTGTTTFDLYDRLRRLRRSSDADGRTVAYEYDTVSLRNVALTDADGSTILYDVDYEYWPDGLLKRVDAEVPDLGPISYSYDNAGRAAAVAADIGAEYVLRSYDWDSRYRVASITNEDSKEEISHFAYEYYPDSTVKAMTRNGTRWDYTYGALNRLCSATVGSQTTTWDYDPAGNRDPAPQGPNVYNVANQLVDDGSRSLTYDAAGRVATCGSDAFQWDEEGLLTQATVGGTTVSFGYNAAHSLVSRTEAGQTTEYAHDVRAEVPAVIWSSDAVFVRDPYGRLLAMSRGGDTYYTCFDGLGSTANLVRESTGRESDSYEYDPWGEVTAFGAGTTNPYKFVGAFGYREEPELELVQLGHRYYGAEVGRFISPDPTGQAGGVNLYVYCKNEPLRKTDPLGLMGRVPSPPKLPPGIGITPPPGAPESFHRALENYTRLCCGPPGKRGQPTETDCYLICEPFYQGWFHAQVVPCVNACEACDLGGFLRKHAWKKKAKSLVSAP